MKFFYLIGNNHKQIVFKDKDQSPLFNLNVTEAEISDVPSSNIYVATERQMMMIANALSTMFGDEVQMKMFSDEAAKSSNIISTRIIGRNAIYGKSSIQDNHLSEHIDFWKSENKDGVALAILGGFSGSHTESMISSSVFSSAINDIQEAGLTMGVDMYVEKIPNDFPSISPHLIPVNTVLYFPVSVGYLNGYDGIFVNDEESSESCGIQECDNYHDFYAKTFGIEKNFYRNIFLLSDSSVEAMGETIFELKSAGSRSVLIDIKDTERSIVLEYLETIKNSVGECTFFSLEKTDIEEINSLASLCYKNPEETASIISQMDLVVGKPTFTVHLSSTFGTPTIILLSTDKPCRKFIYYKSATVVTEFDEIENSDSVKNELVDKIEHMKEYWSMLDARLESAITDISETENNKEVENSETPTKPSRVKTIKKVSLFLLALSAVVIGYLFQNN